MYVVKHRASSQLAAYGEPMPVAPQIAATQDGGSGQAVGLVLAFFSTLMFFTSIMLQGSK